MDEEIAFEAYGVAGSLRGSSPELLERARVMLPPGWTPGPAPEDDGRFEIALEGDKYEVRVDEARQTATADLDVALGVLDSQIRAHVALRSPGRVFVHAGVVARDGGAIVIPGSSFSGKTTLVAALIRAGAGYWSDEFAVLDEDGLVHPYAKPLSIRDGAANGVDHPPESLGATVGTEPVPVALIALASFRPGASWEPERRSPGEGALALLSHTVPARERPEEALAAVRRAATDAVVLEGDRGEADETAAELLRSLTGPAGQG